MAIFYRPVTKDKWFKRLYKKNSGATLYDIEPYRESAIYAEEMLDMKLSVALRQLGFYYGFRRRVAEIRSDLFEGGSIRRRSSHSICELWKKMELVWTASDCFKWKHP